MPLDLIRETIPSYAQEITLAMYRSFIGDSQDDEYATVLRKYKDLFEGDHIHRISKYQWGEDDESRANFYLRGYFIGQWYSFQLKELMDEINRLHISRSIEWKGRMISIREAKHTLNSPSISIKDQKELESKMKHYVNHLFNPKAEIYYKSLKELSQVLGYKDFIEAANDIRRYKVEDLLSEIEVYVRETEHLFYNHIYPLMDKNGFGFRKIDRYDPFSVRRTIEDIDFLRSHMNWSVKGIEVAWVHSKNRFGYSFCVPVQIPGHIILVSSQEHGFRTQRHLYHEFGHGFHFSNTEKEMEYEFRRMGDHAVAEAYSALIEGLLYNQYWLKKRKYDQRISKLVFYYRVYLIRKYWAKLKTEVEYHKNLVFNNRMDYYKTAINDAEESTFNLLQLDDELTAASQLRAWLLHAQLESYLIRNYDVNWFEKKEVGNFLKELFSYGYKYNADEISQKLGFNSLNRHELLGQLSMFAEGGM